jgi:hypothetical protein
LPPIVSELAKNYVFTWNNPTLSPDAFWDLAVTVGCGYLFFQTEEGAAGTEHYQGLASFDRKRRITQLKAISDRIHWEVRRGTLAQAKAYCSKEATRVAGPFEYGAPPAGQGERNDISVIVNHLRVGGIAALNDAAPEALLRYPSGIRFYTAVQPVVQPTTEDPRRVILLFGPPGCGKTRHYFDAEGQAAPLIDSSNGFWFEGYNGGPTACLDDFDGSMSKWTLKQTLSILDRYHRKVPIKGGFVDWTADRVYVTTNYHPRDWFDWSTREPQWYGLVRRFTTVIWFKTEANQHPFEPIERREFGPGEEWDRFWRGPNGQQRLLDASSGQLVSRAPKHVWSW